MDEDELGNILMINVIYSSKERHRLYMRPDDRVDEFKNELAETSYAGYEQNAMKLIYKGDTLEDHRTLDSYGLQSNQTIYVEGANRFEFFEETDDDDDTVTGKPNTVMPDMSSQLIPVMTQMMQSLLSSSLCMKLIVGHNPQLQSIFDSNPQLRDMMQNPDPQEFFRLTSPQMMQVDLQSLRRRNKIRISSIQKMDDQRPEHGDISLDASAEENRFAATKVCKGAPCGFSDAKTSSNDAKERSTSMWKLWAGIVLCIIFMTVEVVCGIKANSLAILTDAAHLLSDVAAFGISLFSVWASGWEATPRQSYGFFRIEILGTLVSILIIWWLTGILVYEAVERLINSTADVQGSLMFGISTFGLVVNIVMMFILGQGHGHGHGHDHDHSEDDVEDVNIHGISFTTHQHHSHGDDHDHHHDHPHEEHSQPLLKTYDKAKKKKRGNMNVQGAYLHVLGDLIQSIGVMIGAAVIWYNPKLKVIDPVCTLLFSLIVLYSTVNMLRDILEVLMESTPREIDATSLERGLCEMDEVVAIHELHIWAITVGKVLLACHVMIRREADADMTLGKVVDYIKREYKISHVTIQIERE